ncbi:MAG TPA: Ig-like domain-containing protein [Pyrinomonadaceae bacterium]
MKRMPLFFVIAFALLALAIMPSARMEVSPAKNPTPKNAVAPAAITAAPVPPPTVSLTSPFNNAQFLAGATIRLTANAADSDGTISKVEFFQGAVKLATDTASPYEFDWTNVAAGNYVLTAVATDNQSQATTSTAVNIAVLAQVKQLVGWSSITNGTDLGNGSVRKTSTGAWDFTAVALQTLLAGDGYFESTAANFNQSISLTGANGQSRTIVVGSGGWVGIYEGSTEVAATVGHIPAETITSHAAGDRYRIEITNSILRYIRYRGAVREVMFQSAAALPTYPMTGGLGISPQNAEWQKTVLAQLTRKATWSAIVNGVDLGNGSVRKTSTGTWDFSATAAQTLARGDGYFESTASYWNHSINATGSDGAARALLVGTGGWAAIYEGGVEVASTSPLGNLSAHAAGDRYRLEISGTQFRYVRYRGGIRTIIFTSSNAVPAYPISFSLGMSFQNSEWQNTVFAQLSNTVTWSSISNGIDLGNGSVRKTSTGTWDFSSVARQQMVFGPGHFESTASYWNHSINLGGTDGAGRALLAGTGGWAAIYENGAEVASTSPLGNLTAHAAGDRYRLELISGKLRYVRYRSGARSIIFTSTNAIPAHPLGFSLGMSFQNSEWQNTMFSDNVPEHNDASFVSQSVPATMTPGQTYSVIVVMRNTGTSTWTPDGDYQLGSENLSDNTRWGMSRVNLNATVRPGEDATFSFMVTAPAAGSHSFQWRMVQNAVQRFGALTTNVNVNTVNNPPTVSLTGPAQGATFTAPATVPFTATASDSDGTITKVEFFQGTTKVVRTPPRLTASTGPASLPAVTCSAPKLRTMVAPQPLQARSTSP